MDSEEFIKSVSSTEMLTHAEALNLILTMKGSKPREELPFSSIERQSLGRTIMFRGCQIDHPGANPHNSIPFTLKTCKKSILISSVFLLNPQNYTFNTILLKSSVGTIHKLESRQYEGQQLYEVVFRPPVVMMSGERGVIVLNAQQRGGQTFVAPRIRGQNTVYDQDVTISMRSTAWLFLVGFKYRNVS